MNADDTYAPLMTVSFSLRVNGTDTRNHVCKVEIMKLEEVETRFKPKTLFTCRRIDNGNVVLAWEEDFNRPVK